MFDKRGSTVKINKWNKTLLKKLHNCKYKCDTRTSRKKEPWRSWHAVNQSINQPIIEAKEWF